jgi:hypothetical protein
LSLRTIDLLKALSEAQVRYVLVGGMAVQLHGYFRATFDVDLVLAMDDENLTRFIGVAKQIGLVPSIPVPIDSLRNAAQIEQWHREMGQAGKPHSGCSQKGMLAFALREPQTGGGVVDVLVRPEVPFEQLHKNAVVGELFSQQVMIASIDDLLTMKRCANRDKDKLDIAALEKIKRGEDPNE